jgi:imidazolonepropionase-like amidohydrolase
MQVKFTALAENDINTSISIAEEFGLNYCLDVCYDIANMADTVKEKNIPCVLGALYGRSDIFEGKNKKIETGIKLEEAGVEFAMSTEHPAFNLELLPAYMALMAKSGMSEAAVFKGFTINAAKAAGLSDKIGSIEVGKAADIVIWSGTPFDYYSAVEVMIVDGEVIKD